MLVNPKDYLNLNVLSVLKILTKLKLTVLCLFSIACQVCVVLSAVYILNGQYELLMTNPFDTFTGKIALIGSLTVYKYLVDFNTRG
jgi:hypothetical protein